MENLLENYISQQIRDSYQVKKSILADRSLLYLIEKVSQKCVEVYRSGKKTLLAGNGGSAADAQHIAAEFVGRFDFDRPSLPSIALTTDTSMLTAIANDYGYENVFRRQIQANGTKGDLFLGISTSGQSPSIVAAVKECQKMGIVTVGLTGARGGCLADICDYCIRVPSDCTPRIQESHILIGHIICSVVEEALFGNKLSHKPSSILGVL
jgi:D-sedoheptulose 7-phosphate isomerase